MKDQLAEKMAGEIALSPEPGATMRKWREEFKISQQELARHMTISPSVISDYEKGTLKIIARNGMADMGKVSFSFFDKPHEFESYTLYEFRAAPLADD